MQNFQNVQKRIIRPSQQNVNFPKEFQNHLIKNILYAHPKIKNLQNNKKHIICPSYYMLVRHCNETIMGDMHFFRKYVFKDRFSKNH